MLRRSIAAVTAGFCLLLLTGCQERRVQRFTVDKAGGVTVVDVTTATLASPSPHLTSKIPDLAALQAKAVKRSFAFVGAGVDKPVVSLRRVSARQYVLSVSQHFASPALLHAHYAQFDPAVFIFARSKKPTGPTIEALEVVPGRIASTGAPDVSLHHVGRGWSFTMVLGDKAYTSLQYEAQGNPGGVYHSGKVTLEIHVQLPGTVVSTNGRQLGHSIVSWDLYSLKSPTLFVKSRS